MIRSSLVAACTFGLAACAPEPADETDGATPAAAPAAPATVRPLAFQQCAACHSIEPGKHGIGPSLAGVHGAPAANVGEFAYSTAMRESGLVWDDATLDAYLANPRATVPGTKMSYAGLRDAAQRAELIAWLEDI